MEEQNSNYKQEISKVRKNQSLIVAYKFACIALCLFLCLGAWGMIDQGRYYDAGFGSVPLITTVYFFNKPSVKNIGIILLVLAVAMYLVGAYDNVGA